MNYNGLAYTGAGALTVGGLTVGAVALVAVGLVLVVGGALLVRRSFRRGKSPEVV